MILPPRREFPEAGTLDPQQHEAVISFVQGFNHCLDMIEAANMKPDGHYWDHTSKGYRDALATPANETAVPPQVS